jgi:hypothetical protein
MVKNPSERAPSAGRVAGRVHHRLGGDDITQLAALFGLDQVYRPDLLVIAIGADPNEHLFSLQVIVLEQPEYLIGQLVRVKLVCHAPPLVPRVIVLEQAVFSVIVLFDRISAHDLSLICR